MHSSAAGQQGSSQSSSNTSSSSFNSFLDLSLFDPDAVPTIIADLLGTTQTMAAAGTAPEAVEFLDNDTFTASFQVIEGEVEHENKIPDRYPHEECPQGSQLPSSFPSYLAPKSTIIKPQYFGPDTQDFELDADTLELLGGTPFVGPDDALFRKHIGLPTWLPGPEETVSSPLPSTWAVLSEQYPVSDAQLPTPASTPFLASSPSYQPVTTQSSQSSALTASLLPLTTPDADVPYPAPTHLLAHSRTCVPPRGTWALWEQDLAISHMLDIVDKDEASGEDRFRLVACRLLGSNSNRERTWFSVKNFWNRIGRARGEYDERRKKNAPLATSKQWRKTEEGLKLRVEPRSAKDKLQGVKRKRDDDNDDGAAGTGMNFAPAAKMVKV